MPSFNADIIFRNGNQSDFNPTKLRLGEPAVSVDSEQVYIGLGDSNVVELKTKASKLLDSFAIAEGEDPVAFYQLSLSNQNWSKILIVGTIQSDDTSSVKRQLNIGTAQGFHYCRPPAEDFSTAKNFSVDAERMANGYLRARTVISSYTYINGTVSENTGRKPVTDFGKIPAVRLSILDAQFAAGTSFEVWGVE